MTAIEKVEKLIKEDKTLTEEKKFILRINAAVKEFTDNSLSFEEYQQLEEDSSSSLYKNIMKSLDK